MKILITGAGGQVGTDLLPLLLSRGHTVAGLDLAPAPAAARPASSGSGATPGRKRSSTP
jgi:nucleoside-diphosphate-sugar epimerase